MCRPVSVSNNKPSWRAGSSQWQLWPLPKEIVMAAFFSAIPLTNLFLNRGYTVWFHWTTVVYALTLNDFVGRFSVIQGTSVCLGWYATIFCEYRWHGTVAKLLLDNSPLFLQDYIYEAPNVLAPTYASLGVRGMIHLADIMAHPVLTYFMWRCVQSYSQRHGPQTQRKLWVGAIFASFCWARFYGLAHNLHNDKGFGLFYVGYDIYLVEDLNLWYPAYVVDCIFHTSLFCYAFVSMLSLSNEKTTKLDVLEGAAARDWQTQKRKNQ